MPNLDKKGKIQLEEPSKISLCSSGSGGFLKGLHKQGLMKILKKTSIKYVNVVNSNNLNSHMADPFVMGLFTTFEQDKSKKNIEIISDVYCKNNTRIEAPTILQDDLGGIDLIYPDDTHKAMKVDGKLYPKYESLDLNFFTTVEFLDKILVRNGADIFRYRLKKKQGLKMYKSQVRESYVEGGIHYYSFELNIYNIAKVASHVKLIVRDKEDMILFKNGPGAPVNSEKQAIAKLLDYANDHCVTKYGEEVSKVTLAYDSSIDGSRPDFRNLREVPL